MKRQINKKLMFPLKLAKSDLMMLLVPALLWMGAVYARSSIITPYCSKTPESCLKESVLPIDRLSLGLEDSTADQYSYQTQNLSGVIAFASPVVLSSTLLFMGQMTPLGALTAFGTDLIIVLQTTAWNGFFTEASHLVAQRPRPFVYLDPKTRGTDSAHYTSFYSGHTSYSAAMMTITVLLLLAHNVPWIVVFFVGIVAEILIFSTAYFRILAGRHFLTDVICGAIAGSLIAWTIIQYHQIRNRNKIILH